MLELVNLSLLLLDVTFVLIVELKCLLELQFKLADPQVLEVVVCLKGIQLCLQLTLLLLLRILIVIKVKVVRIHDVLERSSLLTRNLRLIKVKVVQE